MFSVFVVFISKSNVLLGGVWDPSFDTSENINADGSLMHCV